MSKTAIYLWLLGALIVASDIGSAFRRDCEPIPSRIVVVVVSLMWPVINPLMLVFDMIDPPSQRPSKCLTKTESDTDV